MRKPLKQLHGTHPTLPSAKHFSPSMLKMRLSRDLRPLPSATLAKCLARDMFPCSRVGVAAPNLNARQWR